MQQSIALSLIAAHMLQEVVWTYSSHFHKINSVESVLTWTVRTKYTKKQQYTVIIYQQYNQD